jgi:hypothetical protein
MSRNTGIVIVLGVVTPALIAFSMAGCLTSGPGPATTTTTTPAGATQPATDTQ